MASNNDGPFESCNKPRTVQETMSAFFSTDNPEWSPAPFALPALPQPATHSVNYTITNPMPALNCTIGLLIETVLPYLVQ